ncbi:SDR family NAD(P)-dependent oxidoreductase [Maribacter sp. 2307ULW6-5]|uniref:SDR family NAD(P)-dependent oxidoreductase n=1 Tax=Maribacter sp. 2307ULW6-5 TaxID=3386275 RepID=UPI0039BCCEE1
MDFENKKVLITGGTRGIGRCMVAELARAGASHIAVIARDKKMLKQLAAAHPEVSFMRIVGDVAHSEVLREAAARIEDEWGHLDLLINNAGILSAGPLEELPDEELYDQVAVNLTAVLLLTKYCVPLLKASKEGAILNISSGLGLLGQPFYAVYGSTKAALKQFTDCMRRELAPYRIHVACAYPTATDTDMMKKFVGREMESPESVAKRSLQGVLQKELHIVFGGEEREAHVKLNFEAPGKFDAIAAAHYEKRRDSSAGHKAL